MNKKILNLIAFIVMSYFICIINVKAINISVPNEVKAGGTVKVSFTDAKVSTSSNREIYLFSCDNESKVERTGNPENISGFKEISFTQTTGSITYKIKDSADDYTLTFTVDDGAGNVDSKKTASVKVKANKTTKPAATQPSTTTTTTTTKQDSKSNDASLKALTIKDNEGVTVVLTPEFSSTVYEYDGTVSGTVKTVNIEPVANHDKANIVISNNASQELKDGENNKITITVTAEDGVTKKSYVLNIKKDALTSNATLSALEIEEVPNFKFNTNTFKYDVKIKEGTTKLTLKYTPSDEKSIVTVSGNEDLTNGSKIKILVTAEDGTKKEYVIVVSKDATTTKKATQVKKGSSEKNPFIIMTLSITAFGLIGAIVYVSKK